MNISRTRYAVRTLLGPWLVIPAIGLHIANLLQRGRPWRGETMLTLEWLAIAMFVLGPIVCGVAAVDAARLARPTAAYLTIPTRRPRMAFGRAALWAAVPLIGLQAVVYVVALVVGDSPLTTALRPDMLLALLVQGAAIGWYVALGSLVGRFCPPILAGLAGTVLAFFLFYALSGSGSGSDEFALLNLGGATVTQLGRRYSSTYLLVQLLVLTGTAVAMFFVKLHFRQGRARPSALGSAILVGIIAAGFSGGAAGAEQRKTLVAPTPPDRCYEWTPTICVYEYHGEYAEEAVVRIKGLLDATAAAGYEVLVPSRIEQRSYNYTASDPAVATFFFDPGDLDVANWTQEVAMTGLLSPNCPQLRSESGPPVAYFEDFARLLSTWSLAAGLPDIFGNFTSLAEAMTPDEVASVLSRWRLCELG